MLEDKSKLNKMIWVHGCKSVICLVILQLKSNLCSG